MARMLVFSFFVFSVLWPTISEAVSAQDIQDGFVVFAESGDLDKVKTLHYKGATIDGRDLFGRIALQEASASGHIDIVRWLVEQGAAVNSRASSGYTPLMRAIDAGQLVVVKYLVDKGANLWHRNSYGDLPLDLARRGPSRGVLEYLDTFYMRFELTERLLQHAGKGNIAGIRDITSYGFSVNSKSPEGFTALMAAASYGRLNAVKWLIENHADPDIVADNGVTALYVAVNHKHSKVVRFLLDNGAKVINPNKKALSIEPVARKNRDDDILKLIVDRGNDEQLRKAFRSAYDDANDVRFNYSGLRTEVLTDTERDSIRQATKKLLETKANWIKRLGDESFQKGSFRFNLRSRSLMPLLLDDPNMVSSEIMEGLFAVACSTDYRAPDIKIETDQLDKYKDQINGSNGLGETPLIILARCCWDDRPEDVVQKQVVALDAFIRAGADINLQDVIGWTPLMWAAFEGNKPVVQRLLELGANAGVQSVHGDTALSIAEQLGYENTAALIRTVKRVDN